MAGRERQASVSSPDKLPPPALPLHLQGKNITVESIFYEQQKMALGTPCLVQDTAKGVRPSVRPSSSGLGRGRRHRVEMHAVNLCLPTRPLPPPPIHLVATQTVRYWGPVPELGDGDWVGIELENPVGDTDGSYAGKVYFAAQPNHAIFVSPTIVAVRSVACHACLSPQDWTVFCLPARSMDGWILILPPFLPPHLSPQHASAAQPYDESMTPAVIIDDLKKRLQAKELERIRQQQQLKANADSWNKLDAHQEQMLLRRCVRGPDCHTLSPRGDRWID